MKGLFWLGIPLALGGGLLAVCSHFASPWVSRVQAAEPWSPPSRHARLIGGIFGGLLGVTILYGVSGIGSVCKGLVRRFGPLYVLGTGYLAAAALILIAASGNFHVTFALGGNRSSTVRNVPTAQTPVAIAQPLGSEFFSKAERDLQESQARADLERKKRADEQAARAKERRLPDPTEPDYYEKLADRLESDDFKQRKRAMSVLLNTDPSQVASAEAKKRIARAFKNLAEGNSADRLNAIRGMAVWGGKFSVPILLKMLNGSDELYEQEVVKALGELKDARAAPALAARLGDSRLHQVAFNALNDMGSGAEDALIEAARTSDETVCMAAVKLLGNVGTSKSFSVLDPIAESSSNHAVRVAAMNAVQKINLRQPQAKSEEKRRKRNKPAGRLNKRFPTACRHRTC